MSSGPETIDPIERLVKDALFKVYKPWSRVHRRVSENLTVVTAMSDPNFTCRSRGVGRYTLGVNDNNGTSLYSIDRFAAWKINETPLYNSEPVFTMDAKLSFRDPKTNTPGLSPYPGEMRWLADSDTSAQDKVEYPTDIPKDILLKMLDRIQQHGEIVGSAIESALAATDSK